MPIPARTLKTFLRFMLEAFHARDQSRCDLPGHRSVFMNRNDRLISKRFEKTLVGRYLHDSWATAREAPTHRLATHRIAEGDATARPRPGPGWLVWRTAPWSKMFKLVSAKQRGGHTSNLRYRVRSGNMSRGSCYRARRRPPWIVSPLTRNSLAGAARSWPIIEAQSTRCCQTGLCALLMFYCSAASASALVLCTV